VPTSTGVDTVIRKFTCRN